MLGVLSRDAIPSLVVYSSNFTRARQTAKECVRALERIVNYENDHLPDKEKISLDVLIDNRLLERGFGDLDGTKVTNYNYVWPLDLYDAHHTTFGVESVNDVVARVRELIVDLETRYSDKDIVLTSHADTLQIMQCFVAMVDPRQFSQYRFLNAEVRPLLQNPTSLPPPAPLCKIAPATTLTESTLPGADSEEYRDEE
mmetsp:Transcript_46333/g.74514  ORF Transcript_46333/g.74514 Transcript_46333/m.74514 type:complete len:198 (-) Transcript_46333:121-714(-)